LPRGTNIVAYCGLKIELLNMQSIDHSWLLLTHIQAYNYYNNTSKLQNGANLFQKTSHIAAWGNDVKGHHQINEAKVV
jgi:hypothetical protein